MPFFFYPATFRTTVLLTLILGLSDQVLFAQAVPADSMAQIAGPITVDDLPLTARTALQELDPNFIADHDGHYLADLYADQIRDVVVRITHRNTHATGYVLMLLGDRATTQIIGAGSPFLGIEDLSWVAHVNVLPKGTKVHPILVNEETGDIIGPDEQQGVELTGEGLHFVPEEMCGGGVLFRDGNQYRWYQQ